MSNATPEGKSAEQQPKASANAAPAASPPPQTTRAERYGYWSYAVGQSMSYTILGSFLTTYLLLNGITASRIAIAMVAVKLWDAVNDMIFGVIFDHVKWKSGNKSLPWMRITVVAIPLTTIFVFLMPGSLSQTAKIVWFVIAYVLWDSAYTLSDIPMSNLVTKMTTNVTERNGILSVARVFALGGAFVTSMLGTFLVSEKVGVSFGTTALIIAGLAAASMLPIALKGKERVETNTADESYSVRAMFHYLKGNKYLGFFYAHYVIFGCLMTNAAIDLFVSYYLFGSALFSTLMLVLNVVPMLVIAPLITRILKRMDKFHLYYLSNWAFLAAALVVFFIGYRNVGVYIAFAVLKAIPQGFIYTLNLTFTPDCVEYGKYKTGVDARGIAFAIQAFCAKITSLAQPIGLFILGLFGWAAINATSFSEIQKLNIQQSPMALNGLWITAMLIPAIGTALALIPLSFYKLNDHDVQIMAQCNAGEITREQAESSLSKEY